MSVSTPVMELRVATKAMNADDRVTAHRINNEAAELFRDYRDDKNTMRNEYVELYEDLKLGLLTIKEKYRLDELNVNIKGTKRNLEALSAILKETKEIVCKF